MSTYIRRCWRRLTSSKTIKYFGWAILILGLAIAFLPYTQYRGWGWPQLISQIVCVLSLGHIYIDPNALYAIEAKVLAHTADLLFFLAVVFIGLVIHSIFFGKDIPNSGRKQSNEDIGIINKKIRLHFEKLRKRRYK